MSLKLGPEVYMEQCFQCQKVPEDSAFHRGERTTQTTEDIQPIT